MNSYQVTWHTEIFVAAFATLYFFRLVIKTGKGLIDLYDLIMLSMVVIIPALFVWAPSFGYWLAELAGVGFPFVVMFGLLFVMLFVFIHNLTVRLRRLEAMNRTLIQEVSLIAAAEQNSRFKQDGDA